MLKIRRVLISVWDKKGVVDFARRLSDLGAEIVSTGKTASLLKRSNIKCQEVSSLTLFPEILSGRVKTIHPKIFGGILANKKHPLHMEEIKSLDIQPIDMVVVNLYPFPQKVNDKLIWDEMIEYIDIGGPSLLRAAGKNFKNVACVSSIKQYKAIGEELTKNKGFIGSESLKALAQEAFFVTKEYDNCIYNYFRGRNILTWDLEKKKTLRYGENPHQKACLYDMVGAGHLDFRQLQGKPLSYNNFLDLDAAFCCVKEFEEPAAVIVKHASLCGVGIDKKLYSAYKKAYATDTLSSFGGIVSLNRKVDKETAIQVIKSGFKECVLAPAYSKESLRIFSAKPNLRILEANFSQVQLAPDVKATVFGHLIQDRDNMSLSKSSFKTVTKKKPSSAQMKDLVFAWRIVKFVKSNAITLVKGRILLGVGGGQPSRVGAVKLALSKAIKPQQGSVLASDGFFPQVDSIKLAARRGVKAIIQPGGSIKDKDVIAACDKLGMAMVFTSRRHFRH